MPRPTASVGGVARSAAVIRPGGRCAPTGASRVWIRSTSRPSVRGAPFELVGVHHLVGVAHGVHQPERRPAVQARTLAHHRHQGYDARPAAHQQDRLLDGRVGRGRPDEPAADRTAHLELVTELHVLDEVRRDLAVADLLDGDRDLLVVDRLGDRVGALRGVAVRGRQAYVDVLAGQVSRASPARRSPACGPCWSRTAARPAGPATSADEVRRRAPECASQSPSYRSSRHGSP